MIYVVRYNDLTVGALSHLFPLEGWSIGMTDTSSEAAKKAYRTRIGFVADSPNFPGEWSAVVEKVKIADELGFDSIWLGESWGYELFTSMADLVNATKRIKIGAGIANIYSRTPALLASTVATLDERSVGRQCDRALARRSLRQAGQADARVC